MAPAAILKVGKLKGKHRCPACPIQLHRMGETERDCGMENKEQRKDDGKDRV